MAEEFGLMRGLMQLSGLKEQRRVAKEEEKFRKAYEAPFKDAMTKYYNAQATMMADKELTDLQKETARLTGFKADQLEMVLDEIDRLKEKDPENPLIPQAIFGIRNNQKLTDELAMMNSRFRERGLVLDEHRFLLQQSETLRKQASANLNRLFEDSAPGSALRDDLERRGILDSAVTDAIRGTFGKDAPDKQDEEPGVFDRIKSLLDGVTAGELGTGAAPPFGGGIPSQPAPKTTTPTRQPSKAAPKRAPKAQKPVDTQNITIEEMAPISDKARENNVDQLDIYKGIQELVQLFPEMTKEDKLAAADKIAEGALIEDLIEFYRETKE